MAKYKNAATYHEGNDNLNESQFSATKQGNTGATDRTVGKSRLGGGSKIYAGKPIKKPKTEVREVTQAKSGVAGGRWAKK